MGFWGFWGFGDFLRFLGVLLALKDFVGNSGVVVWKIFGGLWGGGGDCWGF